MNIEDVWQEHKGFILGGIAGLFVFLVAWWILSARYADDITQARQAAKSAERKANDNRLPAGRVADVEARLTSAEDKLKRLEKELRYEPQFGFTLAKATRAPDIHFNEVVERMTTEVVEAALTLDIRVQSDLGLAGVTPRTDAEREWYLNGLDIVNRVCISGIAAGVRGIETILIGKPPQVRDRKNIDKPYAREVPVTFSAVGHPSSISRLVRDLLAPGARLVPDASSITSLDDPKGKKTSAFAEQLVRLDMTVKALILDETGTPARPLAPRR